MSDNLQNFEQKPRSVTATFYLVNDDTISVEGCSVLQIFFELNARFPEKLPFTSVEFSGANYTEKLENLELFKTILRRYT
jgi:hypothetical protein